ncbi:uncharacterized protein LOC112093361 [Morus notabilis]|uniref:uncharacterized protein LOC112093361 n=1 Tax=Morus notabilis TaxID=981085 RepID=UPI000CED3AF5|nr:uncharacterized protein LOC112093361 [Morus notabilis]
MIHMELLIPKKLLKLWDAWQIRGGIILSLFLQTFLVSFASCRRRSKLALVLFLIWSAYLLVDWVAAITIGAIFIKSQGDICDPPKGNDDLFAFWASFLLLHLGGPDSITSFALDDNKFWVRHLLGLALKSLAAAYSVFSRFSHCSGAGEASTPCNLQDLRIGVSSGEASTPCSLRDLLEGAVGETNEENNDPKLIKLKSEEKSFAARTRSANNKIWLPTMLVFIVGIVKYGERTCALYLASTDHFGPSTSVLFLLIEKHELNEFDIGLTYASFLGAVVLDSMSFIQLISSDYTLRALKESLMRFIPSFIMKKRRWSLSVLQ